MRFKFLLMIIGLLISVNSFAQIGGNQVYNNNNRYYNNNSSQRVGSSIVTTDTTLVISSKVMLQLKPDYYLVTIGASQVGETVKECNDQINQRIDGLIRDLKKMNVQEDEYYIDFIAQTVLYDYTIEGRSASQYQKGFEIKKNIIIKLTDLKEFDKLIEVCAKQEIYDIIKVDYRNRDLNSIHQRLYKEAMKIVESKKNRYLDDNEQKKFNRSRTLSDRMYSVFPKSQYQRYQAFETSQVYSNSNSSYIKKEARKRNTFYYDGIDISGFDKVINGETPVVGIQYVIEVSVLFKKNKLKND